MRRPGKGLHVVQRYPEIFQAQRAQRLEAEDVADNRRGEIGYRPLFEQVDVVGDVGDVLALPAGHGDNLIALGLVVVVGGEPVGPYDGPGRGRGFPGHRGARLFWGYTRLRRYPECRQDVGGLGLVIGLVVTHLGIRDDPGVPPVCRHGSSSDGADQGASAFSRWPVTGKVSIDYSGGTIKQKLDYQGAPDSGAPDSGATAGNSRRSSVPCPG